jgi:hypothetical protein
MKRGRLFTKKGTPKKRGQPRVPPFSWSLNSNLGLLGQPSHQSGRNQIIWTISRYAGLVHGTVDLIRTPKMPINICPHPTGDPVPHVICGRSVGLTEDILL